MTTITNQIIIKYCFKIFRQEIPLNEDNKIFLQS